MNKSTHYLLLAGHSDRKPAKTEITRGLNNKLNQLDPNEQI